MKLALIADIHEDSISLKEALRRIEKHSVDEIICLGDISGFSVPYYNYYKTRNARECLSLVKSNCHIAVLGNHDIHAATIIPENCSFFNFPEDWYRLDYSQRVTLANNTIWLHEENDLNPLYNNDDLDYLRSLPEYFVYKTQDLNVLLTHYVYPNISGLKKEFYTYRDEFRQHFKFMESLDCAISFTGHSHINGFSAASEARFRRHRFKEYKIKSTPVSIGIPSITSHEKQNGFCIFDTNVLTIQVFKL
ncbi:MAG: metallophosphoesterase [Bacteroidales bacterium]|nr:metallophosphoesterase [Bacteroidales bacterium]